MLWYDSPKFTTFSLHSSQKDGIVCFFRNKSAAVKNTGDQDHNQQSLVVRRKGLKFFYLLFFDGK